MRNCVLQIISLSQLPCYADAFRHVVPSSTVSVSFRQPSPPRICRRLYNGRRCQITLKESKDNVSIDSNAANAYSPEVVGGCVADKADHIRLLDKSLESSSGVGIFRRINEMLWQHDDVPGGMTINTSTVNVTTAEDLDQNERFGILSHGIQKDPIYNYGNRASVGLFEQESLEALCQTPSRYSTVPSLMDDRGRLIQQIEKVGHGTIVDAVRTSANGKLFVMKTIWVWNVYHDDGRRIGLAALYDIAQVQPYYTAAGPPPPPQ